MKPGNGLSLDKYIFTHGPVKLSAENSKLAALTFDDGPDSFWTPFLLDILAYFDIKATFMCLGALVSGNHECILRMVEQGHVIGNHTWDHPDLSKISSNEVVEQIERTSGEIYRATGLRTALFRPPYGVLTDEITREIIRLQHKIILWDVDSNDWKGVTSWHGLTGPKVAANILSGVKHGSIVLQHNAGGIGKNIAGTLDALPYVIETLQAKGFEFVTVSDLLKIPAYQNL